MNPIIPLRPRAAARATAVLLAAFALPWAAQAQAPGPWWAHAGPVSVQFSAGADLEVGGSAVPTASASAKSNVTLGLEVGYELWPSTIVSLTVGIPPTTTLTGRGAPIDGLKLGRATYAPAVLSIHRHLDLGALKPYAGVGLNYTIVSNADDGVVEQLKVRNAFGAVLQVGLDIPVTDRWFAFVDVKKIFLQTRATGVVPAFGNAAAKADVTLNPLLVHAGVGWRF